MSLCINCGGDPVIEMERTYNELRKDIEDLKAAIRRLIREFGYDDNRERQALMDAIEDGRELAGDE